MSKNNNDVRSKQEKALDKRAAALRENLKKRKALAKEKNSSEDDRDK